MRRVEEGAYLRPLLPTLRAAAVRGRRQSPSALETALAAFTALPGKDERFDWGRIPRAERRSYGSAEDRARAVGEALAQCHRPNERLVVVWHPRSAGFRLRTEDFLNVMSPLLDAAPEVWIISDERPDWIIETARFDCEVCWLAAD